jgi:hypothetical protein
MTTKKIKTKNRKTKNRIKGGGNTNSVHSNVGENVESNKIVTQLQEINIHLTQITNAIMACCNSNTNPVTTQVVEPDANGSEFTPYASGNDLISI